MLLRWPRTLYFPIHLLLLWWVTWLVIAQLDVNPFIAPRPATVAQFALLLLSFYLGHLAVRAWARAGKAKAAARRRRLDVGSRRVRVGLWLAAASCFVMLALALWMSGAMTLGFVEYFAMLRLAGENVEGLTGSRTLDTLTKIYAFPMSYTVLVAALASDPTRLRGIVFACVINFAMFAYLWQVNYPLVHMFWFLVFYSVVQAHRRGAYDLRIAAFVGAIAVALFASAVNRFGGDIVGGLQRYVFGYHLVGFSFYDLQYANPYSILHEHSFGRSSLGFLDQVLEAFTKPLGLRYQAASFENSDFTNEALEIGRTELHEFNAFGTILFSFVRDFGVTGAALGGFVYGAAITYALRGGRNNWACGAMFFLLSAAWMMGMMVSPVEQAYFWFCIVTIGFLMLLDRGVRW